MYSINVTVLWLVLGLREQVSNSHPAIRPAQRSAYFACTNSCHNLRCSRTPQSALAALRPEAASVTSRPIRTEFWKLSFVVLHMKTLLGKITHALVVFAFSVSYYRYYIEKTLTTEEAIEIKY